MSASLERGHVNRPEFPGGPRRGERTVERAEACACPRWPSLAVPRNRWLIRGQTPALWEESLGRGQDWRMKNPPPTLDGARSLEWASLDGMEALGTCRVIVNGVDVTGSFDALAICRYDSETSESYYLFSCDSEWKVVTDTLPRKRGGRESAGGL